MPGRSGTSTCIAPSRRRATSCAFGMPLQAPPTPLSHPGTLAWHLDLEERLAEYVEKEAALVFSTGYQTNVGTISALVGRGDYVITDKDDHASIVDGCRLSFGTMKRFRHNNVADLERVLKSCPEEAGKLVIVDGVFSMGGDITPLPEIVPLCQEYGARLMVDDAHAMGVLGGGQGTRLYPLTKYRSKPAVPLAGKYRLIDIPLSNCINSGLNRCYVLTQFNSVSLHRHIRSTYVFDPFDRGFVEVLAAQQTIENATWYQGTADAVRQNLRYVEQPGIEYVLILSGDQLYLMELRDFVESHREHDADLTIAVKPVSPSEA